MRRFINGELGRMWKEAELTFKDSVKLQRPSVRIEGNPAENWNWYFSSRRPTVRHFSSLIHNIRLGSACWKATTQHKWWVQDKIIVRPARWNVRWLGAFLSYAAPCRHLTPCAPVPFTKFRGATREEIGLISLLIYRNTSTQQYCTISIGAIKRPGKFNHSLALKHHVIKVGRWR
jgi:hypothetical protein